jgi:hypothetical protein
MRGFPFLPPPGRIGFFLLEKAAVTLKTHKTLKSYRSHADEKR